MFDVEAFTVHTPYLEILRGARPARASTRARPRGAELTVAEAVQLALPEHEWETVADTLRSLVATGGRRGPASALRYQRRATRALVR